MIPGYNDKTILQDTKLMDTLFEYFASTNDFITIRANKLGYVYLDLQVYSPMYLTVKWRNQGNQNDEEESRKNKAGFEYKKVNRGETVRFSATLPTATDQEILVFGGRFLKDLGDLSNLQPSTLLISQAVNLTNVTCHSPNLTTTDFSTCTKLQTIDLSDCEQLGSGIGTSSTLNVAACTNLRSINAFNTQLTAILTNLSGGNLEEIRFPYSVQTIMVKNQPLLRSLGIPVYYTGQLTDPTNRFVERLVSVDIANCEKLESLITNYCQNDGVPVEVPVFLGVKYGQTFSISNSLTFLERLDLSYCANLQRLSLSDFLRLRELNIDDITAWDATSSNLSQLTLNNCPNVETITFNQNTKKENQSLGVAFKSGTILDLSGLTHLKHVVSNCGVKGLKTLILPLSVVSLVFDYPSDTTYTQGFSDIENIWSVRANHSTDGFKGIDLMGMDTITDFSMGSLNLIERAENLNLKITKTFPYFNYHKTSNFFQPTGIVDISDYTDSLANLFKGVDLEKLAIVCTKPLTQTNASYMFAYASCRDQTTIPQLFQFMTNVNDLSYMFYQASILYAPSLPPSTNDCRYMFYNCDQMIETPANWENTYTSSPLSEGCYTGCVNLRTVGGEKSGLDYIPISWGGFGRQDASFYGYNITANDTLSRTLEEAKMYGESLRNLAPAYGITPTLVNYRPSFHLSDGLDAAILVQDGTLESGVIEGISLTNLAKRTGETKQFERFNETFKLTEGLEEGIEVIDGEFVEAQFFGKTLQNIVPTYGLTEEITVVNQSSYGIDEVVGENIFVQNGDYQLFILKGNSSHPQGITGIKVNIEAGSFSNTVYLQPTLTLRSCGDIFDEYNVLTQTYTKRISAEGDVLPTPLTEVVPCLVAYDDRVRYGYESPNQLTDLFYPKTKQFEQVIQTGTLTGSEEWTKLEQGVFTCSFLGAKSETFIDVLTKKSEIASLTIVDKKLTLTFNASSYVYLNKLEVAAFKVWLKSNKVQFKYELKEHLLTPMTLENFDFKNAHYVRPKVYKNGVVTLTTSDQLTFPTITFKALASNRFELPILNSNTPYTLSYVGVATRLWLGGVENDLIEAKELVQSGSSEKVALFDQPVFRVMLIKGDVRKECPPYFEGFIHVKHPTLALFDAPIHFGKGGRLT